MASVFYNEANNKLVFPPVNAIESQDRTFAIFDQEAMDYYKTKGVVNGWAQYAYPGQLLTSAEEECDAEIAKGNLYVFKSDSLEEMLTAMQLPVERSLASIEHYNQLVDNGEDTEYFKPADYLNAVRTPPFYGARLKAMIISRKGGIHCNNKGEVTTRQGKSIPGLYVAGMDRGGFQSQTTGITIPGSVQGTRSVWAVYAARTRRPMSRGSSLRNIRTQRKRSSALCQNPRAFPGVI